ncbi:MAG: hypothetical protein E7A11_07735 [Clostridium sp.]|jgi:hypothetical protein|uniref:hypothetical protein n=1 Tax=Clostridium sp. TaxID=1506 RepID=UPI0029044A5D|nr:hypothetical protein [Clostridium sp.]MDU1096419.1 hypothetical protein [Clostridioides difficile]MDU1125159.1 hypothetical protein [Clostridium sp.]MDU3676174.1 hypothetical protein [Clostridium sp.]MDU6874016.1 hypothetical protein [Clostridium sp.]MDU6935043.1 hypothetical protein [Clostridium sp.]
MEEFYEMLRDMKSKGYNLTQEEIKDLEQQYINNTKSIKTLDKLCELLKEEYYYDYVLFLQDYEDDVEKLDDNDKFDFYKEMYTQTQYSSNRALQKLISIGTTEREKQNILNNIKFKDGKVKIYRGINKVNSIKGNSWTINKKISERFAFETLYKLESEYKRDTEFVIEKEIDVEDILFFNKYYMDDIEDEICLKNRR